MYYFLIQYSMFTLPGHLANHVLVLFDVEFISTLCENSSTYTTDLKIKFSSSRKRIRIGLTPVNLNIPFSCAVLIRQVVCQVGQLSDIERLITISKMGIISPNFGRKRKNIIGVALLLGLIILTWRIVPNFFQTGSDRTFFKKYQQIDAPKKDDALAATTEKASAERTEVIDKDANSVSTLKQCYRRKETTESDRGNPIELFDDVLLSHRKPRINQTIFFIVTRCSTDNLVHLNTRQVQMSSMWVVINHTFLSVLQTTVRHRIGGES